MGHKIRVLVHTPSKREKFKNQDVEIVYGDFAKPETLRPAMKEVKKVFLLCPFHIEQPKLEENVIDEARKAGVTHVVKQSGMFASMEPGSTFGRLHRESEKRLESSGMAWTHLRANGYMTGFLGFTGTMKSEAAFYVPAGDGRISMIDPKDVAAVAVKTLTEKGHEGKAYTITGPETLSYADMADKLSSATGKRIQYINIPDNVAKKGMTNEGMPEWLVDAIIETYGFIRAGRLAEISPLFEQITGRRPRSFDEWARENAEAFK